MTFTPRVTFEWFPPESHNRTRPLQFVTMTPANLIGEIWNEDSLAHIAHRMRSEVFLQLRRRLRDWSFEQINNVSGTLMMYNRENEEHTHAQSITVGDLNYETFSSTFARATGAGSNPNLQIQDVEWKFWINPASLRRGGSRSFTNPNNWQGIKSWNAKLKRTKTVDTSKIGCAAIALAEGIELQEKNFVHRHRSNMYTEFVMNLQNKLQFPNPLDVTIIELQKVLEFYPNFRYTNTNTRLVVIEAHYTRPFIYLGKDYTRNPKATSDKSIYIYHDLSSKHYVPISGLLAFLTSLQKSKQGLCYECCTLFNKNAGSSTCLCEGEDQKRGKTVKNKRKKCTFCEFEYYTYEKHICGEMKCRFCSLYFKRDQKKHRCPLIINEKTMNQKFAYDETSKLDVEPKYELWAWDIESELVQIKNSDSPAMNSENRPVEYVKDEEGYYVTDADGRLKVNYVERCAQLCNFIYCRNVFSGEEHEFEDIESFLKFACMTQNNGFNYFYAHNSSGYDSRLLFETAARVFKEPPAPLMKGSKFMRLQLKNTIFHDSMLHLPGSLANQGKAFNLSTKKGDFPHGFSLRENIDYIGPIPGIKYFPNRFKTLEDLKEFKSWHRSMVESNYVWNYREERKSYCRNDVFMLAEIMRISHENILTLFKDYPHLQISPWFFPTVAGFHHKLQLAHLHIHTDLPSLSAKDLDEYSRNTWCALQPEEHYFAHQALRGGMTNICKFVSEQPIHYVDIQSSYPNCQLAKDNLYPVGPPTIEVHDKSHFPCRFCYSNMSACSCKYERKKEVFANCEWNQLEIKEVSPEDIEDYCRSFTGIICVDIDPPSNLYHPLIQEFDTVKKKVIGTLLPLKKTVIPCIILKRAMDVGYKVRKIYRADRYKLQESKWRNGLLGDMYLAKMMYAGQVPESEHARMKETFKSKFDIDLGDMTQWSNNPVRKHTSKILINCGWGKHAESVDHRQSSMYKADGQDGMDFYESLLYNQFAVNNVQNIGENLLFKFSENRRRTRPQLHKTYLPVAVYVTAYGRLSLWNEMIKVDPPGTPADKLRVLMYDTDSIVYECRDHKSCYHIEEGDCLGDWETEKIETKGKGIKAFYAIGPKSYSIVPNQGPPLLKLKGACIDHSHSKLVSPLVMKDMVINRTTIELPQTTLDYKIGDLNALSFRNFLKVIRFNVKDCKGTFNESDNRVYPLGFAL